MIVFLTHAWMAALLFGAAICTLPDASIRAYDTYRFVVLGCVQALMLTVGLLSYRRARRVLRATDAAASPQVLTATAMICVPGWVLWLLGLTYGLDPTLQPNTLLQPWVVSVATIIIGAMTEMLIVRSAARWARRLPRTVEWTLARAWLVLLPIALLLVASGLFPSADGDWPEDMPRGTAIPAVNIRPTRPLRVWLVGLDGADWRTIAALSQDLPALSRFAAEGATAPLATYKFSRSPVVWTTIATGRHRPDHGVYDMVKYTNRTWGFLVAPQLFNPFAALWMAMSESGVYTYADWRARPLWEVRSDTDPAFLLVNWWYTTPAPHIRGVAIADQVSGLEATDCELEPEDLENLRAEQQAAPRVYPPGLHVSVPRALCQPAIQHMLAGAPADERDRTQLRAALQEGRVLEATVAKTDIAQFIWTTLRRTGQFDLAFFVSTEIDVAAHTAMMNLGRVPADEVDLRSAQWQSLRTAYRKADALVGEMMAEATEDTVVILVSDHGWEYTEREHHDGPDGILGAWGGAIRRGLRIPRAAITDVAPTMAWFAGLPLARDLPGRVLTELLREGASKAERPLLVWSWGRPQRSRPGATHRGQEKIGELRALGYLQ